MSLNPASRFWTAASPSTPINTAPRCWPSITATAEIDPSAGRARFVVGERTVDAPSVAIPVSGDGRYHLDLLLDPRRGFGVLYINRFRALSFRYYGLSGTVPAFFADGGFVSLDGEVRTKSPG